MDAGRGAVYSFDALARLSSAVTTGSTNYPKWGLSFAYDRYGNRTGQSVTAGTGPSNSVTIDPTTNRITGTPYSYDLNGNMTNDGLNTLTYDAENRLVTSSSSLGSGTYTYDGKGLRVQKVSSSTTTVYIFSGSKVVAEYDNGAAPTAPTREYIYAGGQLLAKIEGGVTNYYHADHLSARVTTDSNGNKIGEQAHFPFGESWYSANTTTKFLFTSYERDAESGNDYAMTRYNVNRLGRFSSPDPLAGSTGDPQSLNRYSYVRNDAVDLMDPQGLCPSWGPYIVGNKVVCGAVPTWSLKPIYDPWMIVGYSESLFGFISPQFKEGYETPVFCWMTAQSCIVGYALEANAVGGGNTSGGGARDVVRHYSSRFQCSLGAAGAVGAVEANFASFANYSSPEGYVVFSPGPISQGETIQIDSRFQGGLLSVFTGMMSEVQVGSLSSTNFSFETVQGHHPFYPGPISFSASNLGRGQISFSVDVNSNFGGLIPHAAFLLGGSQFEENIWRNLINNIAEFCRKK